MRVRLFFLNFFILIIFAPTSIFFWKFILTFLWIFVNIFCVNISPLFFYEFSQYIVNNLKLGLQLFHFQMMNENPENFFIWRNTSCKGWWSRWQKRLILWWFLVFMVNIFLSGVWSQVDLLMCTLPGSGEMVLWLPPHVTYWTF